MSLFRIRTPFGEGYPSKHYRRSRAHLNNFVLYTREPLCRPFVRYYISRRRELRGCRCTVRLQECNLPEAFSTRLTNYPNCSLSFEERKSFWNRALSTHSKPNGNSIEQIWNNTVTSCQKQLAGTLVRQSSQYKVHWWDSTTNTVPVIVCLTSDMKTFV